MWTPKGQAKSVHISKPSTVVDTLGCGHIIGKINGPGKKCPLRRSVHIGGVSTRGNSTVLLTSIGSGYSLFIFLVSQAENVVGIDAKGLI